MSDYCCPAHEENYFFSSAVLGFSIVVVGGWGEGRVEGTGEGGGGLQLGEVGSRVEGEGERLLPQRLMLLIKRITSQTPAISFSQGRGLELLSLTQTNAAHEKIT